VFQLSRSLQTQDAGAKEHEYFQIVDLKKYHQYIDPHTFYVKEPLKTVDLQADVERYIA